MRGGSATRAYSPWDKPLGAGALVLAAAAPLAIGGVHATTQLVLATGALVLAAVFIGSRGRTGVRVAPFCGLLALAAGLTLLQLLPLPAGLVHLVSPAAWELRGGAGWMPLTVDVPATVLALVRALACLALLLVVGGLSARSRRRARLFLLGLTLLGGGFAALALLERALHAPAIAWLYTPRSTPGAGFLGTFVDVNHAAALLSLTALCAFGLGFELQGGRRAGAFVCAGLATAALLLSASRGGLVGFAVGGLLLAAVLMARAFGLARGLVTALVLLTVAASVTLWAGEGLRARFLPPSLAELWRNQKTRGWRDGLTMAAAYPWSGVGRGAFEAPLRAFRSDDESVRLVYPEDVLVQYGAEWGLPATAAIVLLALGGARRVARQRRSRELTAGTIGAAAAVLSLVVHELFDFSTELLGVALPATVALGVVAGRVLAAEGESPRAPRRWTLPLVAAGALVLLGGGWAAGRTLDADDLALHEALAAKRPLEPRLDAAIARHPADDYLELLAAEERLHARDAPAAMRHLNRALVLHPANWQAHQLAARLLASAGHRAQAALEYRSALATGMPDDYAELGRVLGHAIVDAVPQTTPRLTQLAAQQLSVGHVDEAGIACQRAVDLAERRGPALAACVKLALPYPPSPLLAAVAQQLADEASAPEDYLLAADGLARAHEKAAALATLERGMKRHRTDAELVLRAAQLHADNGELAAARALIGRAAESASSLEERLHLEQLLAQLADRAGDSEAALLARSRARMIRQRMDETLFNDGATQP